MKIKIDPGLVNVAIAILPEVMALFRQRQTAEDPNVKTPDDAEMLAALQQAVKSSQLRDDIWLAAHPKTK